MHALEPSNSVTQPKLTFSFLISSFLVLSIILSGQWVLNEFFKLEYQQVQRLHDYEKQFGLVNSLMGDLTSLVHGDIGNVDYVLSRLMDNKQQLEQLQNELLDDQLSFISNSIEDLERENITFITRLTQLVPGFITGYRQDQKIFNNQYQSLLHDYNKFQNNNHLLVKTITETIARQSDEYTHLFWLITGVILLLFFVIAFIFYRWLSLLISKQFARQRQVFEKQIEQEQRIKAIVDTTVDAIITISDRGIIETFNQAAEKMFGYLSENVIGKNINILMPEPVASQHDNFLKRYRTTGERKVIGLSLEVTVRRSDNNVFPVLLSVSEVKLPTGSIFTGILHDLTQRKKEEEQLKQLTKDLLEKQQILEQEEKIARHVFENITITNNDILPEVSYWSVPLASFSGDLMLSSTLPNGGIRILLCDFTGHGLPAALGAVPVSMIFHAMTQKGLPLDVLMIELNQKLKSLLPTGIFCCISAIDIDATRHHAHIWNAGLPDVLLMHTDGQIKQRFSSRHLPLGVMEYNTDELQCEDIVLETGDMIYIFTDGLTEAENEAGERLGQARFEQILACKTDDNGRLSIIQQQINQFMGKTVPNDDLSIIEIKTLVTEETFTLES